MKNLSLPSDDQDQQPSESTKFVLDSNSTAPSDNISYGLTLRSTAADADSAVPAEQEDLTLKRFHEDMRNLPEDRGMDEFKDVPVEGFGAAILAGYGWSEGKGIGRNNKGDTKVVQYDRRAGTQGLGYNPTANDAIVKAKKGSDTKYLVNKMFKIPEPVPVRIVRIVLGRHVGLKGEVLRKEDGSELVLRLVDGGKEVRVDEEMVAELGSEAEERCLRKLKELEIVDRKEKRRDKDDKGRSSSGDNRSRDSKDKSKSPIRWLRSHIRVRVISKDFKGGRWYLKKGEVVDVVGPTTCDISMDGNRELVQGVDQEILETALPKRGGSVLVLYGRHKGVYGSLVERDMEEETGVVRDADSHDLINVRLEQIAEYVGDPSYLGY